MSFSVHLEHRTSIICFALLVLLGSAARSQAQAEIAGKFLGIGSSFRGWRDETPILRQEDILDDGSVETSFYSFNQDGALIRLDPPSGRAAGKRRPPRDPPGLNAGKLLVLGHQQQARDPVILLQTDVDPQKVEALERAIRDQQDGLRDAEKGFPDVPAKLKVQWIVSGQKPVTLWQESRTLSASGGEAGYRYSPPYLGLAVLSPSGKTLLVGLTTEIGIEYQLIVMPAKSK